MNERGIEESVSETNGPRVHLVEYKLNINELNECFEYPFLSIHHEYMN